GTPLCTRGSAFMVGNIEEILKRYYLMLLLVLVASQPAFGQDAGSPGASGDDASSRSKTTIGAYKTERHLPTRDEILKDSKPLNLSIPDAIIFREDKISVGSSRTGFLINRLTGSVEYVWHQQLKRFVRPKFFMVNAQALYDRWKK
ncbi:MAG: hypothetical protein ABH875_03480, partial [Candidatus Omnitrophota bacterium]